MTDDTTGGTTRRTLLATGAAGLAAGATLAAGSAQAQEGQANGPLAGRSALVTGAARGIGRAIALEMARGGADVIALDVAADIDGWSVPMATPDELEAVRAEIEALGVSCATVRADIRDRQAMRDGLREASGSVAPVGVVVANAGIAGNQPFLDTADDEWEANWDLITDVNVKGTANTIRAAGPTLVANGGGAIIVTSSTFGRQGNGTNPAYVASKWALQGLVKAAAIEFGPQGVTVNAIAPTAVRTGLSGPQTEEQRAEGNAWLNENYHPMDIGLLEPEDIAPSAVYLATEAARLVTGATIDVAAGANARYTA
ncbi:SDR family oxidoreductase [Jannaschia sp. Os4]|uniref:SDR family NAD(P)-dependent oxidoreductase n=1 Tax=Jannaschia sp. Os4 TaxID=2807617 RepID=UPI00193A3F97|nr:SDR family NAD(P)-dependent oxidoreductase [Jannaschia sp. Os4]MBM2578138.1 SDR family oxidoreductase [Jannaschia sp. Os4]